MRIEYNQNPLATKIYINDTEKELIKLQLLVDKLTSELVHVKISLEKNKIDYLVKYFTNNDDNIFKNAYIDEYLNALTSTHEGDCVGLCYTCDKCIVEDILNINTISDFSGNEIRSYIDIAFRKHSNIDDVIDHLLNYKVDMNNLEGSWTSAMIIPYIPEFEATSRQAGKELQMYKKKHNF